jgi:hypothetical protein
MKIIAASILGLSMLFATASADAGVVVGRPGVVVRGGFGPRVGWYGPRAWGPRVVVGAPGYYAPAPYVAPAPVVVGVGPRWWGPRYGYARGWGFRGGWRR